ncbi:hypothetical protein CEXT_676441 [Caerostris extrusa]|uniref:Uncharacterized protein n=1 Tax=Caerostris extrusa TaxID=172846 RepID=A0AAV4X2C4_CAEEX|nr:hypothetical protein CEXT_676441 [Caerostris extrusa]
MEECGSSNLPGSITPLPHPPQQSFAKVDNVLRKKSGTSQHFRKHTCKLPYNPRVRNPEFTKTIQYHHSNLLPKMTMRKRYALAWCVEKGKDGIYT